MSAKQIKQRLEMILDFMQPHWEFVNCHMVNYLTNQHWEHFIPIEMRMEVPNSEQVRLCTKNVFWQRRSSEKESFPFISQFIQRCRQHCLDHFEEILKTTKELKKEIGLQKIENSFISVKEFLTDKKRHEVEIMAQLVNDLISSQFNKETTNKNVFIVDAGDGKGYLSSRLSLEYGYKVLGIDANEVNTENALERNRKLQRAWNGLVKRADLVQSGITPPRRGKKPPAHSNTELQLNATINDNSNYRTTAKYIDTNLCLNDLLRQHFPIDVGASKPQIILSGLHTCGNLAPTCLRVFNAEPNCQIVCNIGCCYHFLKEAYTTSELEHSIPLKNEPSECGFPMSNFLREKKLKLGRNARMLAAQCVERTLANGELPNISLFYRALLEVIICRQNPEMYNKSKSIQVGRIRKFQSFSDYLAQCAKKTKLNEFVQLETKFINDIEIEYAEQRYYLELFYLIRMLFAPILESLILLDRLLYLKELGYERSYLVSAFDAIISPRHYAVIAIRN